MNYIDTNIFNMKSLEDVSRALKYNYAYLSSLFKKTTGNTVVAYYQRKRLESARLILLEENAKIGDVSDRLGYSSPYSFSRAFKEAYGVSPKKYMKTYC
jgi:AraC-like DNA-binding protein